MTSAALSAQPSVTLRDLRRDLDASIHAAEASDETAAPHAWGAAADAYVALAKAELEANPSKGFGDRLGFRSRVESQGLIVTQGIQAAMGTLSESSELSGKFTAASQALFAYESRGDR